ncbi:hypothetical protein GCM10011339_24690 [Echinicola rosea]|uniref:Uncharacterized protein n=1 Tax=Echinicola rosea TaxID=1807691 RepID=A0ABQ1V2E6_9BACT|nr:hypothetical protein GCM10011339_24690 [Echinicola rosea]
MLFVGRMYHQNSAVMFTLFKQRPTFPKVKPVNLKDIQMYMAKFEESLKNFDEVQKENIKSITR